MEADLKDQVESKLTPELIYSIYSSFLGEGKPDQAKPGQYLFICPYHKDDHPSLGVDTTRLGLAHCFACDTSKNIYSFLQSRDIAKPLLYLAEKVGIKIEDTKKTIPPGFILEAKELLRGNQRALEVLYSFGVNDHTIDKYNLGYKDNWYWIPVLDENNDFVNVRKYNPNNKPKIMSYEKGYGENNLWPIENLNEDIVYIMEGEKDCLVALSLGYNAITNTCGATSWNKAWNKRFKNKNIVICYDVDTAGTTGAKKVVENLYDYAAQIKIVELPIPEEDRIKEEMSKEEKAKCKKDFCDYISFYNNKKEDFDKLVERTQVYIKEEAVEYKCILAEASRPQFVLKKCDVRNVIVCGRDGSPFIIPKKVTFTCSQPGSMKMCAVCECSKGVFTVTIDPTDYIVPEMISSNTKTIDFILRKHYKLCTKASYRPDEFFTIDRIRMSPNTSYNIEEDFQHVIRTGVYVTDAQTSNLIETNKTYNIKALTIPDPKTQYVMHQIYDISDADTNTDNFVLDEDLISRLKIFQAEKGGIQARLDDIYTEYSYQSRIYGRQDLFLMYDLTFFSAITFDFQGQNIGKGWVESCAIGDSGVGKTSVAKFLLKHYRSGELIDGETCTEAGLKGGLSQIAGQWQLQWGRIPINDRRLVVIDEASGLDIEAIAKMSNIRSSGECILQKVISDKTRARTRIIWISNPRKQNTGITHYVHGVEVIKDFFGKPEDVRRCDVATTVASGEIPLEVLNMKHKTIVPKYTTDLSHQLIRFAWSLRSENISITEEAEDTILEIAQQMGKKYSPVIPLVEASDIRNKLARLSVSLAIRLFNINETGIVIVTKEHVQYIAWWLSKMYSKPRMGYDKFSEKENNKTELKNIEEVERLMNIYVDPNGYISPGDLQQIVYNLTDLLDYALVSIDTMCRVTGLDVFGFNKIVGKLQHANAITHLEKKVKLNPCMIDHLRILKDKYEKQLEISKIKFEHPEMF